LRPQALLSRKRLSKKSFSAQKRVQNAQDVGISITVTSNDTAG
jgi:hypothetical protein